MKRWIRNIALLVIVGALIYGWALLVLHMRRTDPAAALTTASIPIIVTLVVACIIWTYHVLVHKHREQKEKAEQTRRQ